MILAFRESAAQARDLAAQLDRDVELVEVHRFPDGESKVRVPPVNGGHAILYRSLDYPNNKLIELLLAACTLRQQGVQRLTLVAPYLCYMRQDMAFHAGEAISQRVVGEFLAGLFDDVITVDPHLHRIDRLEQAIPARTAVALTAAGLFGAYLASGGVRPLLLGPDEESAQWVHAIATASGLEYAVARKQRNGDKAVSIELPPLALAGRSIMLVDDMASTGHTLAAITRLVLEQGALDVKALVTHALFSGDALEVLRSSGLTHVASSDSIPHPTNVVALAPLLAQAVRGL